MVLETKDDADLLVKRAFKSCEDLIEEGYVDHVKEIVRKYGDTVLIAVNVGGPSGIICANEFAIGLIMLYQKLSHEIFD